MSEKIEFTASIPVIQSALNVGGDQAARLKLDIPASDLPQILQLIAFYAEKSFRVTVEPVDGGR